VLKFDVTCFPQGPSEDLKTKLSLHEDVLSPRLPIPPVSRSLTIEKKGVYETAYGKRYDYGCIGGK
jgi:hypothetical protein